MIGYSLFVKKGFKKIIGWLFPIQEIFLLSCHSSQLYLFYDYYSPEKGKAFGSYSKVKVKFVLTVSFFSLLSAMLLEVVIWSFGLMIVKEGENLDSDTDNENQIEAKIDNQIEAIENEESVSEGDNDSPDEENQEGFDE